MDLTGFLTARLNEVEAAARATVEPRTWHGEHLALHGRLLAADEAHIKRHDPARVLREVEAHRKILAEYADMPFRDEAIGLRFAVGALAAIWSDHPDFDPAWKE
jgi:hypothetical protein